MKLIHLTFYASLRLQFLDVKTNPGTLHPVSAICMILCGNVQVAWPRTFVTLSQYDNVVLRDFGLRYVSCVRINGSMIWSPYLVEPGQDASGPRNGCIHTRWFWSISNTQI